MEPEAAVGERVERRSAIERVAGNRMARFGQVHANLMAHPGARARRDQGEISIASYRLAYRFDQRRGNARAGRIRRDRHHAARVARVVRERFLNLK